MMYEISYKPCTRCHGTGHAIKGSRTTKTGAEPIYTKCWDCDNGHGIHVTKNRSSNPSGSLFQKPISS